LDLLRTFPPDVNFLEVDGVELSKEAKALGDVLINSASATYFHAIGFFTE
jgi:hypothetical protein